MRVVNRRYAMFREPMQRCEPRIRTFASARFAAPSRSLARHLSQIGLSLVLEPVLDGSPCHPSHPLAGSPNPTVGAMRRFIKRLLQSEDGATSIEYAVLLALIVVVCIGSVLAMSNAAGQSFDNSASQLSAVMGGS